MTSDFDVTIVGAGVIGLAIAQQLAPHYQTLVIERHEKFGQETSSRSSEVIHAGLYYPAGSLKERLCLEGKALLYEFCERYQIPHRRIGKLVVSQQEVHPKLELLTNTANRLGIPVESLDRCQLKRLEPSLNAKSGLLSPSTGIIDSHEYMLRLATLAESEGALAVYRTELKGLDIKQGIWHLALNSGGEAATIRSRCLINCAGLHAIDIAHSSMAAPDNIKLHPCRGHYYGFSGPSPFSRLIYPVPEDDLAGLGIHATLDLAGNLRFGPDTQFLSTTEWKSKTAYQIPPATKPDFVKAIRAYFPGLDPERLQPDYAGIRPKLSGKGDPAADFLIQEGPPADPFALHLIGIESPGLTASLAIAKDVLHRMKTRLS